MKLSTLQRLLEKVITDKDQFKQDQYTYVLDPSRFTTKTVLYGITSTDANVQYEGASKSSSNHINKEIQRLE